MDKKLNQDESGTSFTECTKHRKVKSSYILLGSYFQNNRKNSSQIKLDPDFVASPQETDHAVDQSSGPSGIINVKTEEIDPYDEGLLPEVADKKIKQEVVEPGEDELASFKENFKNPNLKSSYVLLGSYFQNKEKSSHQIKLHPDFILPPEQVNNMVEHCPGPSVSCNGYNVKTEQTEPNIEGLPSIGVDKKRKINENSAYLRENNQPKMKSGYVLLGPYFQNKEKISPQIKLHPDFALPPQHANSENNTREHSPGPTEEIDVKESYDDLKPFAESALHRLRKLKSRNPRKACIVKHQIEDILFKAEIEMFDDEQSNLYSKV